MFKKVLKVQILIEVAISHLVRKRVSFLRSQERKYTKISKHRNMILSSILTLLKNNMSHLYRFY